MVVVRSLITAGFDRRIISGLKSKPITLFISVELERDCSLLVDNTGGRTTAGGGGDGGGSILGFRRGTAGGGSDFDAEINPFATSVLKRLDNSGGCDVAANEFPVAGGPAMLTGDFGWSKIASREAVVLGGGRRGWRTPLFFET